MPGLKGTDPAGASVSPLWKIETQIHQDTVGGPTANQEREAGIAQDSRPDLQPARPYLPLGRGPGLIHLWFPPTRAWPTVSELLSRAQSSESHSHWVKCVPLGKELHLSEPQFLQLSNGIPKSSRSIARLRGQRMPCWGVFCIKSLPRGGLDHRDPRPLTFLEHLL